MCMFFPRPTLLTSRLKPVFIRQIPLTALLFADVRRCRQRKIFAQTNSASGKPALQVQGFRSKRRSLFYCLASCIVNPSPQMLFFATHMHWHPTFKILASAWVTMLHYASMLSSGWHQFSLRANIDNPEDQNCFRIVYGAKQTFIGANQFLSSWFMLNYFNIGVSMLVIFRGSQPNIPLGDPSVIWINTSPLKLGSIWWTINLLTYYTFYLLRIRKMLTYWR